MIGASEFPAWLLESASPALFDAGITIMGPLYLTDLQQKLGNSDRLAWNFLTHAHFDHAGSAPYLKRKIPGLRVGASRLASETVKKDNAIDFIRNLSSFFEEDFKERTGGEDIILPRFRGGPGSRGWG